MAEKSVQTYIRAPNGDLYCIDDERQAFRLVSGPGEHTQNTGAQSTTACHVMLDQVGAHIVPEADLPLPEGASIVPDQMASDTVPEGIGASIVPDGMGSSIVPDGLGNGIVPDGIEQQIRS